MIEMMIIALICGIVIMVLAGKQARKDNKIIRDFNREKELRDEV